MIEKFKRNIWLALLKGYFHRGGISDQFRWSIKLSLLLALIYNLVYSRVGPHIKCSCHHVPATSYTFGVVATQLPS